MAKSGDRLLSILVPIATVVTIAFNGLASTGRINGVMTNEPSDRLPTVVTPAGYAFSIWGIIYLGLLGFSIYQLLPSKLSRFSRIRYLFIASCVLNCAWLLSWHYYYLGLCVVLILGLLATLVLIIFRLRETSDLIDAIFTKGVFGLYAGWVTAASLVNSVIFIRSTEPSFSTTAWNSLGVAVLLIAAAAAALVRYKIRNFVYPLAIAWAATAIAVKQSGNTSIVVAAAFTTVVGLVAAGSVVVQLKDSTSE